jgi:hypothetical protein
MSTDKLSRICGDFRLRLRSLLFQAGIARALVLALVLLPGLMFFDWWLHLGTLWRCVTLLVFLGAVFATIRYTLIDPISGQWTNEQVLSYLDGVAGEDGERGMLLDLYELQHEAGVQELETKTGRELAQSAMADLTPVVDRVRVSEGIHRGIVARWLSVAALLLVVLAVAIVVPVSREYVAIGTVRFFNPFSGRRWPHRTTITLEEPDTGWRVAQMESFQITAEVSGEIPSNVLLSYRGETTGYWIRERLQIESVETTLPDGTETTQHRVRYQFPEVRENMRFTLEGGDFRTEEIDLRINPRPFITGIEAVYEYPPYSRLPNETKQSGQLAGIEGTTVNINFTSSMKLRKAVFRFKRRADADGASAEPQIEELPLGADGRTFTKRLVLKHEGTYQIELHEEHGFREARPERYDVVVTPDYPPEVEMLSPAQDLVETRNAAVRIAFRYRDDFGIAKDGVQLMYAIDGADPQPLSKLITGPLKDYGRGDTARFTWDLRRMKDLPPQCEIVYFARVRDVNPVGSPVDSASYRIRIVPDYVVHLEAVERARRLMTEARIGSDAQLLAWNLSREWRALAAKNDVKAGAEDHPLWLRMVEAQDTARRAAQAIEAHLQGLTVLYNRNHMAQEFMAARLTEIGRYVTRLTGTEHAAIESGLRESQPRSSAEAAPQVLLKKRAEQVAKFHQNQRLACFAFTRVLVKLYDWRDLQTASITARMIYETQLEVRAQTIEIAPRYIGKHILDLTDKEQEDLITLGKRQQAIFDTETELERQLTHTTEMAERAGRMTIVGPLRYAFRQLRDARVNDHLKEAARLIADNQPDRIVKDQTSATDAMQEVLQSLVRAGEKVDPEPPIDEIQGDPKRVEVEIAAKKDPDKTDPTNGNGGTPTTDVVEPPPPLPPPPADALAKAVYDMVALQENVVARTRFLGRNLTQDDMPRFRALTRGALLERQALAAAKGQEAIKHAGEGKIASAVEVLNLALAEFEGSRSLIAASNYSETTQQIQMDSIALLKHLHQRYLAMRQDVANQARVNRDGEGLDAFRQPYRIRGKNLDPAIAVIDRMDFAWMLQNDVLRRVQRFVALADAKDRPVALEKKNREIAAKLQERVLALIGEMESAYAKVTPEAVFEYEQPAASRSDKPQTIKLTWPIAQELGEAGADAVKAMREPLAQMAAKIRKGDADEAVVKDLTDIVAQFAAKVQATRGLFDAIHERRVIIPEEDKPVVDGEAPPPVGIAGWSDIHKKLNEDESLPAPMRERMLRAIKEIEGRTVEHKYDTLLKAYYESFTRREADSQ